jgi:hypothetical protein
MRFGYKLGMATNVITALPTLLFPCLKLDHNYLAGNQLWNLSAVS